MPLEIAYEPLNISEFAYIGVLGLSAPIKGSYLKQYLLIWMVRKIIPKFTVV